MWDVGITHGLSSVVICMAYGFVKNGTEMMNIRSLEGEIPLMRDFIFPLFFNEGGGGGGILAFLPHPLRKFVFVLRCSLCFGCMRRSDCWTGTMENCSMSK